MCDSGPDFDAKQKVKNKGSETLPHANDGKEAVEGALASVAAFREQIRKDAKEEIERILGRAQLSASRRYEEAEKEAEGIARQIRKAAEEQAKAMAQRAMSDVSLERKRTILRAQGEIVDEVLEKVRVSLNDLNGTNEYLHFLKELTVQGIMALEEQECLLAPATEDRQLYTPQLVGQIEELVERRTGKRVKLTISEDLSPEGSGVQVYFAARTMLFDNTLEARMERLTDELKGIIAREVFASDEGGESRQADRDKVQRGRREAGG